MGAHAPNGIKHASLKNQKHLPSSVCPPSAWLEVTPRAERGAEGEDAQPRHAASVSCDRFAAISSRQRSAETSFLPARLVRLSSPRNVAHRLLLTGRLAAGWHTAGELAAINAYRVCRSSHHFGQARQLSNVLGRSWLRDDGQPLKGISSGEQSQLLPAQYCSRLAGQELSLAKPLPDYFLQLPLETTHQLSSPAL